MAQGWRFRLVGPLEVRHDGVPVPIAAPKQRILTAVLALAADEPVTVERLITCLWGEQPPATARNTLQNYVLRLRRTLQVDAEPSPLVTSAAGYRLDVDTDAIDVHRFGALVRSARSTAAAGEPDSAAALLDEALLLWRGEPLADVPSEVLRREVVPGLVEQRLAAREQRIDLDLGRGRHRELITELVALTTEQPLRERIWAQLILALVPVRANRRGVGFLPPGQQGPGGRAGHRPWTGVAAVAPGGVDQRPGPDDHRIGTSIGPAAPVDDARRATAASRAQRAFRRPRPGGAAPAGRRERITGDGDLGHRRHRRHRQDRAGRALGASARRPVPRRPALRQPARFRPDRRRRCHPDRRCAASCSRSACPRPGVPADPDEQVALYRSIWPGGGCCWCWTTRATPSRSGRCCPAPPAALVLVTSRDQLTGLVALDGAVPLTPGLAHP